jgi:ribosome biogenesis GTPase
MGKDQKLTKQQQHRVEIKQSLASEHEKALVLARFSRHAEILTESGEVLHCNLRRHVDVLTGDKVSFLRDAHGKPVIDSVLPRTSVFLQTLATGKKKAVAANVDALFLVIGDPPGFLEEHIDRTLVAAEMMKIQVIIVLNKIDLYPKEKLSLMNEKLKVYEQLTYPVMRVSAKTEEGLDTLNEYLKNRSSIFAGQSGVGKSSLVNVLHPKALCKIGGLSEKKQGKHTTTATMVFQLGCGGKLMDTPGRYDLAVLPDTIAELSACFVEFHSLVSHCKFRNCTHRSEPECAVREASESSKITLRRYEMYLRLCEEMGV